MYKRVFTPYFDKSYQAIIKTIIKEYSIEYLETKSLLDLYADFVEIQNKEMIEAYTKNLDAQREIALSGASQSDIDNHNPKDPNFWYYDEIALNKHMDKYYG